jgi:hypothetical protein
VFASHGTLTVTDARAGAAFSFGSNLIHTYNASFDFDNGSYMGDISCDRYHTPSGSSNAHYSCLDKNDLFILANPYNGADNPPFMNLYKTRSIKRLPRSKILGSTEKFKQDFDPAVDPVGNLTSLYLVTADLNINWASTAVGPSVFHIYKFVPNITNSYHYVSQCSNRGLCNTFEGMCECFAGYSGEACQDQNTVLA